MASARKPLSFAIKPHYLKDDELIVAKEEGTANSVPAAAVIQRSQALFGFTGRKGCVVSNAISELSSELSHPTYLATYAPFTPSESEQRLGPLYYCGCWHRVSRPFLFL